MIFALREINLQCDLAGTVRPHGDARAEHHGTFLRGLRDASSQPVIALIDSSEFVARFGLSGERMQQRKRLWETFLKEQQIPYLIGDLASEDAHEIRVRLAALL